MTPRPRARFPKSAVITLRVSEEMFRDLHGLQDADGVPIAEQIRRGITLWLKSKGIKQESAKRRAETRRKA